MKKEIPASKSRNAPTAGILLAFLPSVFTAANVAADVVYVTSRSLHGPGPNVVLQHQQ